MKPIRLIFASVLMLMGCSTAKVNDYAAQKPVLDIREFFNGNVEAWGMFVDRNNKVDTRFHATMKGTWKQGNGVFTEDFTYEDGSKQMRTWKIRFIDEHHFVATAEDVIGEAKGTQYGNAVNMKYVLAVTTKEGKTYNVSMDDWMYRIDATTVLNRIEMSKFGIRVGELIATFQKK